jgi:hypothetical protein
VNKVGETPELERLFRGKNSSTFPVDQLPNKGFNQQKRLNPAGLHHAGSDPLGLIIGLTK